MLCGGLGTRMREETEFRPKPMVEIGGRPILWHIMKRYAAPRAATSSCCCLGYRGAMIKEYFLNYRAAAARTSPSTLATGHASTTTPTAPRGLARDAGRHRRRRDDRRPDQAGRSATCGDADLFLCTYGDGVADVDIGALVAFHRSHGRWRPSPASVPPRASASWSSTARGSPRFAEKPTARGADQRRLLRLRRARCSTGCSTTRPACSSASRWSGWPPTASCASTATTASGSARTRVRDVELLRSLWERGAAPWRMWDDRSGAAPIPGDRRGAVHAVPDGALAPKDA